MKKQYFFFAALFGLFLFANINQADAQNRNYRTTKSRSYYQKQNVEARQTYRKTRTNQPRYNTSSRYRTIRDSVVRGRSFNRTSPVQRRTTPGYNSRYRKPAPKYNGRRKPHTDSLLNKTHIFVPNRDRNQIYPSRNAQYRTRTPRQQNPRQQYQRRRTQQYRR